MEFSWTEQTIRWFAEASDYTGYHARLAEVIRPMIRGCDTMCDMGCGMGRLALELAGDVGRMTCVDISAPVLEDLAREIARRKITNIEVLLQDCDRGDAAWDALLLSFFGSRDLPGFLPRCRRLIAVVDGMDAGHLYPSKYKRHTRNNVRNVLDFVQREGIPHRHIPLTLEFGQPFRDRDEAAEFITVYARCPREEIRDYLAARLVAIEHDTYRWYLPHEKRVSVIEMAGGLSAAKGKS